MEVLDDRRSAKGPGTSATYSAKKRVLFPINGPITDDMSDLKLLSSTEDSGSSPDKSSSEDETVKTLSVSPTVQKAMENLLTPSDGGSPKSVNSSNNIKFSALCNRKLDFRGDHQTPTPLTLTVDEPICAPVKCIEDPNKMDEENSSSAEDGGIKPSLFYGTNRATIELIRKIRQSRLADHTKVKAKLFSDEYYSQTKKHYRSVNSKESKKSDRKKEKPLFSGVGHGIKKRKLKKIKKVTKIPAEKSDSLRTNIKKSFDLSKIPHNLKKTNFQWDYHFAYKKPERMWTKEDTGSERKFFKSSTNLETGMKRKMCSDEEGTIKKARTATRLPYGEDFSTNIELLEFLEDDTLDETKIERDITNIINNLEADGGLEEMFPQITKQAAEQNSYKPSISYLATTFDIYGGQSETDHLIKSSSTDVYTTTTLIPSVESSFMSGKEVYSPDAKADPVKTPMKVHQNENKCSTLVKKRKRNEEGSEKSNYFPLFSSKQSPCSSVYSSSPSSTTFSPLGDVTNKKKLKRLEKAAAPIDQYQLDAGQKKFGALECKSCKMVYYAADPIDEQKHLQFHYSTDALKYRPWKNENVVGFFGVDRVIQIRSSDAKSHVQKVTTVLGFTENEIGTCPVFPASWTAYLYVRGDMVVGCLIAEPLSKAYRAAKSNDILLHFEEPQRVRCGINRIWTKADHRKAGIATSLVNCLRKNFVYGEILTVNDIAFSATTDDGHGFATKYTGREDYLIYSCTV